MACREWERTSGATWMHEEPDEATESDPAFLTYFGSEMEQQSHDTAAERFTGYGDGDTETPLFSNSKPVGNRTSPLNQKETRLRYRGATMSRLTEQQSAAGILRRFRKHSPFIARERSCGHGIAINIDRRASVGKTTRTRGSGSGFLAFC